MYAFLTLWMWVGVAVVWVGVACLTLCVVAGARETPEPERWPDGHLKSERPNQYSQPDPPNPNPFAQVTWNPDLEYPAPDLEYPASLRNDNNIRTGWFNNNHASLRNDNNTCGHCSLPIPCEYKGCFHPNKGKVPADKEAKRGYLR